MAKAFTEGEVAVHPIIKCELASLKCGNDFINIHMSDGEGFIISYKKPDCEV